MASRPMARKARKKAAPRLTIGVDLGGTKIATGLVDANGQVLAFDRRPSKPNDPSQSPKRQIQFCVNAMADAVVEVIESRRGKTRTQKCAGIMGIGLAAAGPLNVEKGLIVHPANFHGWGVVPIVRLLDEALRKRKIRLPLHFQNDAIAAALAEGWVGRATKCLSYAMITLGTGTGTGVILNGRPAQSRGMGSEWGHLIVDLSKISDTDASPKRGTAEAFASGTGLKLAAETFGLGEISTAELAEFARRGDKRAILVFEQAAKSLAAVFFNLSIGFRVDLFTYTGGLLPIEDLFVPKAISLYRRWIDAMAPEFIAPIQVSKLGNDAGMIGAARLPRLQ